MPACASECLDPNGSGQWCCEACEGKTCLGGTATSRAGSRLEVESSTANVQKGKLGFWVLLLCSCVISLRWKIFRLNIQGQVPCHRKCNRPLSKYNFFCTTNKMWKELLCLSWGLMWINLVLFWHFWAKMKTTNFGALTWDQDLRNSRRRPHTHERKFLGYS